MVIFSKRLNSSALKLKTPPPPHTSKISPITRRILAINILALVMLVIGLLYVGQYRESLINSETAALSIQAELFAAALGETTITSDKKVQTLSANLVRPIMRRMSETTGTVVHIVLPNGQLLITSQDLAIMRGFVYIQELPPPNSMNKLITIISQTLRNSLKWLLLDKTYERVTLKNIASAALEGENQSTKTFSTENDGLVLSVAVPIQRYKQVLGALILIKNSRQIDDSIFQVRLEILKIFGVVLLVTVLLSVYLAGTIARPIRRLAKVAKDIRNDVVRYYSIPDILRRNDEIGELGVTLRDMTDALWQRIDIIESFAADVAHEIKNPLASIKSAVETLPKIRNTSDQNKLMKIILDDISRIDRLITDISDASRLDAELSRAKMEEVDIIELLNKLNDIYKAPLAKQNIKITLLADTSQHYHINGISDRLMQVFRNIIDNAVSFSPNDSIITIKVNSADENIIISITDEGPGLPKGTEQNIFKRFYQERPKDEKFGTHSGLGLSISEQVIKVHGGIIKAENVRNSFEQTTGACFSVFMPKKIG